MSGLFLLPVSQVPASIAVILLLYAGSKAGGRSMSFGVACLAIGLFLANYCLLVAGAWATPLLPWSTGARWNWLGKILSIGLSLIAIYILPRLDLRKVGFVARVTDDSGWLPVFWTVLAVLVIGGSVGFFDHHGTSGNAETLVYQATLPGLAEELLYRGLLFSLFNRSVSGSFESNGAWLIPALCVSVLFGSLHGVHFIDGLFRIDLFYFAFTTLMSLLLIYLRVTTRSLLLPVLAHNAINVLDYSDVLVVSFLARVF